MPEGLTAAAAAAAAAAATDQPRAPLKEIDRGDDIRLPMLRETGPCAEVAKHDKYARLDSKRHQSDPEPAQAAPLGP